jgi:hypothetical protein
MQAFCRNCRLVSRRLKNIFLCTSSVTKQENVKNNHFFDLSTFWILPQLICLIFLFFVYFAVLQIRIRIESGSRSAKITHKSRTKVNRLNFLSAGCSLLRAGGFSCSLDILNGGLGISKLQEQKNINFFFNCIFSSIYGQQIPGYRTGF